MFNYAGVHSYRSKKMIGGSHYNDNDSHHTLYAGIDPADPKRFLIRKLVQVNNGTYCLEETRVTPAKFERKPTVHT